jgi:phosphoglycolate phosphatase
MAFLALAPVSGMLGTIQALQAIKVILNLGEQLIGKLMTVDALDLNFRTLQINKDDYDKAYPIFLDLYTKNTSGRSSLYPGVREGLDYMKAQGYTLGCVTNKAEQFTLPILKDLGIFDEFGIVISGDTLAKKKPDPLPLLHAAKFFGVNPKDAMMLGDSISDVKASRAAGFGIICMSYGYNHGNDIRDTNPDLVIDSMVELKDYL